MADIYKISTRGQKQTNNGPSSVKHPGKHARATSAEYRFTALDADGKTPRDMSDVTKLVFKAQDGAGATVLLEEVLAASITDTVTPEA